MFYIIFDLEFNQYFPPGENKKNRITDCPFEITQIGAVKLDSNRIHISEYNRYIKPSIYSKIDPFITELTRITLARLQNESPFPDVFRDFSEFVGGSDSVLCSWGLSDLKILFQNATYHGISHDLIPKHMINVQHHASLLVSSQTRHHKKNMPSLQTAAEALEIPIANTFHDAYHDALYTSEVFRKIFGPSIEPVVYDPHRKYVRPRQPKREIDRDSLIKQFEKMYARPMSGEEQQIILLAYKMGQTNQFIKEKDPG